MTNALFLPQHLNETDISIHGSLLRNLIGYEGTD